jgi:hypothetical protein
VVRIMNHNHLFIVASIILLWGSVAANGSGYALQFDGVDDYVQFNSLQVVNSGILTHSTADTGQPDHRIHLTITQDVSIAAGSQINANGKGYSSASGPGAGSGSNGGQNGGIGGMGDWTDGVYLSENYQWDIDGKVITTAAKSVCC